MKGEGLYPLNRFIFGQRVDHCAGDLSDLRNLRNPATISLGFSFNLKGHEPSLSQSS